MAQVAPSGASIFSSTTSVSVQLKSSSRGLDFLKTSEKLYVDMDSEWIYVYEPATTNKKRLIGERHLKNVGSRTRISCCCFDLGFSEISVLVEDLTEIFTIVKPAGISYWLGWVLCCGKFGNEMIVNNLDGSMVARIAQSGGSIVVTNDQSEVIFYVRPPFGGNLFSGCRTNIDFKIEDKTGELLGITTKQHGGLFQEFFTDARTYTIEFNPSLDYHVKFVIWCSLLLLDYVYFQKT